MPQHDDDIIPHQDEVEQVIEDESTKLFTPVLFDITEFFTPAAGFTFDQWSGSYLIGGEVVLFFDVYHVAALAVDDAANVNLGTFAEVLHPFTDLYGQVAGDVRNQSEARVGGYYAINGVGGVTFRAFADIASTANLDFEVYGLRYPINNAEALREAIGAF